MEVSLLDCLILKSNNVQDMEEDSQETLVLGEYVPPVMDELEGEEAWLKKRFFTLTALTAFFSSCSVIFTAQEKPDVLNANIPVATPCRGTLKIPEAMGIV